MTSNDEKARAAIAEQAGEWLVEHDAGPLDAGGAAALTAWLTASPVHVEEFLGVSAIVRDLRHARDNPEYTIEAILARARAANDTVSSHVWGSSAESTTSIRGRLFGRWPQAAVALAACAVLAVGLVSMWFLGIGARAGRPDGTTVMDLKTRHGEQLNRRLADGTVVHVNTDSELSIRYSAGERLVVLNSGQGAFEVTHDARRPFRVRTASAELVDLGTVFDVRIATDATVVTVVAGRVAVAPNGGSRGGSARPIDLTAGQQVRVAPGQWPLAPVFVDADNVTAWQHRRLVFEREPLAQAVEELNRYSAKRFEIDTPALRDVRISGVFATDDIETFTAFLRSLKGVRVEDTPTEVRVTQSP